FEASIEQLLWPEKREHDSLLGARIPGVIDRTTHASYLRVPVGYLPDLLQPLLEPASRVLPWVARPSGIEIGPIPKGAPVGLLANLSLTPEAASPAERLRHDEKLLALLLRMKHDLKSLPPGAADEEANKVFANLVDPLLELSKCPDLVVNRGHYFGTDDFHEEPGLSDSDKRALIAFIKTF
ncbi:MAG TPA: hypothetical protein VFA28_20575, partial [Bryobacteraceae bacterium]|nr:hypothetical protein [Bryobacteraceae bacterium]